MADIDIKDPAFKPMSLQVDVRKAIDLLLGDHMGEAIWRSDEYKVFIESPDSENVISLLLYQLPSDG